MLPTIRIQIPETVEYGLTKTITDTMFKRAIRNVRSGIEDGMRFTDYEANPIMVNLALDAVFNRKSGSDPISYQGKRQKLSLTINHETCAPPRNGLAHIFTIQPA